jgi:DNA-binding transcriptional ArsR family regulator
MSEIPQRLQQFIANYVFSLSELEILLYLRDKAPEKCTIEMVGKALLMHRPAVEPRLEALRVSGLVSVIEKQGQRFYIYSPAPELALMIDDLAKWYKSHPHTITTLIFSKPIDKIIRGFADSFRLRKKEEEDD